MQCLANLFCNRTSGVCPNCRQTCNRNSEFEDQCRLQNISTEGVASEHFDTTIRHDSDHTGSRTYGRNDIPQPMAPQNLHVMCCRLCAGVPPFRQINDRRMQWAPTAIRNGTDIIDWQQIFLCMSCSREIRLNDCLPTVDDHTCEICENQMSWIFDATTDRGERRCVFCDHDALCRPINNVDQDLAHESRVFDSRRVRIYGNWLPPNVPYTTPTNSAFYVPLFLDAAGFLDDPCRVAWENHPLSSSWWRDAVSMLRDVHPISREHLLFNLQVVADSMPDIRMILQRLSHQQMDQMLSFSDAILPFIQHNGYIDSRAQEILLQCFGDAGFSSRIDILTDAFR